MSGKDPYLIRPKDTHVSQTMLMSNGRSFLVPIKRGWWDLVLQRPQKYELLVFSNKTIDDFPSQFPYPLPPPDLDRIQRHLWRVRNGFSYVTPNAQSVLRDDMGK